MKATRLGSDAKDVMKKQSMRKTCKQRPIKPNYKDGREIGQGSIKDCLRK